MNKFAAFCMAGVVATGAFGHDLWVWGENGDKFKADMIYGHNFPTPEKIKEERTVLFENVKVIGKDGEQVLKQTGENYHFEGKKLKDGVYVVNAYYKPTAWIEKADGKWEMNMTRKDTKEEVKYCGVSTMQSKAFIKVGNASDSEAILKPIGRGLEITPTSINSIDDIKVDEVVKFKLTLNGKPVKKADIHANYNGYSSNLDMAAAGFARTDLEGNFEFRPLKKGLWYLKAKVNSDSGNPDCEVNNDNATLVFEIK